MLNVQYPIHSYAGLTAFGKAKSQKIDKNIDTGKIDDEFSRKLASTNIYEQLKDVSADSIKVSEIKETPSTIGADSVDIITREAKVDVNGTVCDVTETLRYNTKRKERNDMQVTELTVKFPDEKEFTLEMGKGPLGMGKDWMSYLISDPKDRTYIHSRQINRNDDSKYPEAGFIADLFLSALGNLDD